jgi:fermentation-respiration switch protein FrsA (DUF1100 family)
MPIYDDKLVNALISLGSITPATSQYYISALYDFIGLLTADLAETLEPPTQKVASETTTFTRYILLAFAPAPKTVLASIVIKGTGHIFVDYFANVTYNYRYYGKLVKTPDFSTFTNVTPETMLMNYSRSNASTAGWYDEGTINGAITGKAQLNAGEALLLAIRGASWSTTSTSSSTGLKTTNFKVYATVLA